MCPTAWFSHQQQHSAFLVASLSNINKLSISNRQSKRLPSLPSKYFAKCDCYFPDRAVPRSLIRNIRVAISSDNASGSTSLSEKQRPSVASPPLGEMHESTETLLASLTKHQGYAVLIAFPKQPAHDVKNKLSIRCNKSENVRRSTNSLRRMPSAWEYTGAKYAECIDLTEIKEFQIPASQPLSNVEPPPSFQRPAIQSPPPSP